MRLAFVSGKTGKPSLLVDASYHLWIGNETEEELVVPASELCGFNTGAFEFKIVRGKTDRAGVAWRLESDMDLVVYEKKAIPLCQLLHKLACNNGLADVTLLEHLLEPRVHAVPCVKC